MFYIEMGTVEIVNPGTERVFAGYGTGQTVGEIAFFDGGKREAVARTREATRLLRVPFAGLRTLLGERPGSFSIKTRARSSRSICAN
jgi:CRP-like cAMP-binding protein